MTTATLGFAASYIAETGSPIRFDMDPLDEQKDRNSLTAFSGIVAKMTNAVDSYLTKNGMASITLEAGYSPVYVQAGGTDRPGGNDCTCVDGGWAEAV